MKTRLKTLIILFLLAGLYAIYYFVVPIVFDIQSKTPHIANLVKNRYGLDVKISNPKLKMGLLPSVWIDASNISIEEKDEFKPFTAVNPKIKILLLPLLLGKIQVVYFSCDNLNMEFKFDKHSRFYLGNYLLVGNSNPVLSLDNSQMSINKYKIHLIDELQSKNILLEGNYFELLKYNPKKNIRFSTYSKLKVDDRKSIISLDIDVKLPFKENFKSNKLFVDGTVTNFDLADISPYVKKFSNNKIRKLSGLVNIDAKTSRLSSITNRITSLLILNNLIILGKDKPSSIYFNDKLTLSTVFDATENALVFNKFQILSKRINFNLSGKVAKITSKTPVLDLSVFINKSRIEDLIALIPAATANKDGVNLVALKKYGYYSDLEGSLLIKGKSDDTKMFGEMLSTEGYVIKPLAGKIPKSTVKLGFLGQKVSMDITVPTGINDKIFITGVTDLVGEKNSILDISSTPKFDIKTAQSILNPVHEILNFELGPLPILDIKGIANIGLKINGNKFNAKLNGQVNFMNTEVGIEGLTFKLSKGYGILKFDGMDTHFHTKSASLNNKPLKIDGRCTLSGVLDYNIQSSNQDLIALVEGVNKSTILGESKNLIKPIKSASGKSELSINLKGKLKNLDDFVIGKTVFVSAKIKLLGNDIRLSDTLHPIKNIYGEIAFDKSGLLINLKSVLNQSKIFLKGNIKNSIADISITSKMITLKDILNYLPIDETQNNSLNSTTNAQFSLYGKYIGPINIFDMDKINIKGEILNMPTDGSDLTLSSGSFEFKNSTLNLSKIYGSFKDNKFNTTIKIKNIFQKNQVIDGIFISNNFDISSLRNLTKYQFIKGDLKKYVGLYSNAVGHINLKVKADNNVFTSIVKLSDISCVYVPMGLPLKIYSGVAEFKNDKLNLYKVNSTVDSMPLLIDGVINNLFTNPRFNMYVNSKPNQNFIEKYINTKSLYPLKVKGDIIYSARLIGTKNNFNAKTDINLEKDSNIYYMGSTLGDINDPIRIFIDANIMKKSIKVNNFQYLKLISSQNNKDFASQQLSAKGIVNFNGKNIDLKDFNVKTQNPTDAKIFNILFKKPMIKQGQFTSDILLNGQLSAPLILGDLNFTGVNIPLLDTTIKDISLNFKDKKIDVKSTGEIFSNKIVFSSEMENKLSPPFVFDNIDVYLEDLDINKIIERLNNLEMESGKHKLSNQKQEIDISTLIVKKAQLKADKVSVKNIYASNLLANLSLDEKLVLSLDDFKFDIAAGKVKGNFKYNLLNSNSNLEMAIENVNANEMAYALFDLPDQIYGSLTGEVYLFCNGKNHKSCMDTLSGRGGFVVEDGRMPKLGSLEYLLKATNLIKSGVTGLSINGIVDLITPLKTGQLERINGNFAISSGIADSIQIFSKGKDLSLFINGTYNFSTLIADMDVFGRLSKKISTVLGTIGNASLNTLFNTIPGMNLDEPNNAGFIKEINKIPGFELNDKMYRIFNAKIYGDINGENYVKSFKWVE